MNKQYLGYVNYLRGLAIIGVIVIHTIGGAYSKNDLIYMFNINLDLVSSFSVPLFIFISGLVLTYNYSDKDINYNSFIRKRLNSILIPYLVWSIIYLIYRVVINRENIDIFIIVKKIILGSASFHLYFFVLMMQFYLFFPIILKFILKFKDKHKELLILTFLFNYILISVYYYYFFNYVNEIIIRKIFVFWIFYFILGSVIGLNHEFYKNIISKISFTTSAILFFIALNYVIIPFYLDGLVSNTYELFWMRPQVLVYATVFIFIAFKFKNELNPKYILNLPFMLLKELGKNSFGIYLSHILILNILLGLLNLLRIEINDFIYNVFIFLIVLFMSLLLVRLINRMPFGRFIVGEAR